MAVSTPILLLSALWLVAGCHAVDPARVDEREEPVRLGAAVFVERGLEVGESPTAVAAGDLDRDGHLDLVVANDGGTVTVFRGDGRGGLISLGRSSAGERPTDLALVDVDGDGSLDIVAANHETDYLTILLGDGEGGFRAAANSPLRLAVSPHPHAVEAADLDGDGQVDLVVDDRDGRGLRILRGLGGGAFQAPGTLVDAGGDPYLGMAVGDLDGDGRPDLVTPNPREAAVLLNRDPQRLGFSAPRPLPAAAPFAVEVADLDGDGSLDVVAASDEGSSLVQIFLGDGKGGFREAKGSPLRAGPGGKMIARGDFDGDGVHDVAVTSFQSSEVLVLLGGSDPVRTARLRAGEHPWGLVAADLDEDGRDDLVILDSAGSRAAVYLSRGR